MRTRGLVLAAVALVAAGVVAGTSGWSKLDNRPLTRLDSARLLYSARQSDTARLRFAQVEEPARLPATVADTVVRGLTPTGVEELLRAMKFTYKAVDKQPQPTWAVGYGAYSGFLVLNDRVGDSSSYTAVQFYATFRPTQKPALETINSWNRGKRFCRAWMDDQETAALAHDLDLERGVTKGTIEQAIWIFTASTARFADLLEPRN
ncbi:MAG: YbjN domain-containing protein [Armatimonadetes bacterium]|nr:YbjN domain-containing protein [Armatimonadota bacterium]